MTDCTSETMLFPACRKHRVEGIDSTRGPVFTDSGMVVQAAVEGHGVALGRSALAATDISAGRLVKPFDISLPANFAYYVVSPEAAAGRPKVAAFRDWALGTAQAEQGGGERARETA